MEWSYMRVRGCSTEQTMQIAVKGIGTIIGKWPPNERWPPHDIPYTII